MSDEAGAGRYFVGITSASQDGEPRQDATVRDAFTGEATDSVIRWSEGRLETVGSVSAIEDPGTFLITARARETRVARLYRMRLAGDGHIAGLDDISCPVDHADEMLFLARSLASPDGARVIYTVVERLGYSPSNPPPHGARLTPRTTIVTVICSTGQIARHTSQIPGVIDTLSWDAAGRILAFVLRAADGNTLRITDTTAAEDWIIDSRAIASGTGRYGDYAWSVISPDGQYLYAVATRSGQEGSMLVELPVARERSDRLLARERTYIWNRLCIHRTGHHILLFGGDRIHRASLPGGEVTEVSAISRPVTSAAW